MKIGALSDTHNLLRPEAKGILSGSDLIIHAGDFADWPVLEELELIAPLIAVRGNCDTGSWARRLPFTRTFDIAGGKGLVVHNIETLPSGLDCGDYRIIIYGHSHKPILETRNGTIYLNPGSAGPRRLSLPISLAEILVEGQQINVRLIRLSL